MSLTLTVRVWSCVGQILALSEQRTTRKRKKKRMYKKESGIYKGESSESQSDHRALLLPEVRVRWLVIGCDHVGRVPPSHRSRRTLHHHQPDGRLGRLRVRGVLLGRIFAPAVVHDTRYQEDQEQDNVAGDEDAKVQSDRVDLLVVFQKAHGACFMLGGPEASKNKPLRGREGRGRQRPTEKHWTSLVPAGRSPSLSSSICLPPPSLASVSHLCVSDERRGYVALW